MKSIAVFDSGIGGITFLREAWRHLPAEHFIYFADTEKVPYGTRRTEEVRRLVNEAVEFLSRKNIKALVIACNTATSAAVYELRQRYDFPILGMEPAIKPALQYAVDKRVLVFSTSLTSQGGKLHMLCNQLDRNQQVDTEPFDELVKSAEAFDFVSPNVKNIIRRKLSLVDLNAYGAVVLGCTHFIFYRPLIEEILPSSVRVFDGNRGTLNNLIKTLHGNPASAQGSRGQILFFSSGHPESLEREQMLLKLVRDQRADL
ncbi:MAG TPA: glutamate racemase [Dissulfurispiraceae bacterium]|nr:glutamate racemase [Dissulfurispiraceae bacterium]